MATNPAALLALMKMGAPTNLTPTGDPYSDSRTADIVGGNDQFSPSELDQRIQQQELGDRGIGVSREMIRQSGMQHGVEADTAAKEAAASKLAQLVLPEKIRAQAELDKAKGDRGALAAKNAAEAAKLQSEASLNTAQQGNIERMGAGGPGGAGGMVPKTMNSKGEITYGAAPVPSATIQRLIDALGDARLKTKASMQEMESRYPGITEEAAKAKGAAGSPGWASFLTGGGQKYGNASDMANAANERLKYKVGLPTPFMNLAQENSFGNVEQMAGQFPGVRGLSAIAPLLREHQASWGHETPLSTMQRLIDMDRLMGESLTNMQQGGDLGTSPDATTGGFNDGMTP